MVRNLCLEKTPSKKCFKYISITAYTYTCIIYQNLTLTKLSA